MSPQNARPVGDDTLCCWERHRNTERANSFPLPAHSINPSHNTLCPLNARVNQLVRPWASLRSSAQVIGGLHVQARKNRSHDPDHPFAAFVHRQSLHLFAVCSPHGIVLLCLESLEPPTKER